MRLPPQWGRLTGLASSWWHALCLCPTRQPRAVDHHPSQSHLDLCRVSLWTTSRRASMNWLRDVPYIIGPSSWDVPRRGRPVPPAAHEPPAAVSPASNWACDASSQGWASATRTTPNWTCDTSSQDTGPLGHCKSPSFSATAVPQHWDPCQGLFLASCRRPLAARPPRCCGPLMKITTSLPRGSLSSLAPGACPPGLPARRADGPRCHCHPLPPAACASLIWAASWP